MKTRLLSIIQSERERRNAPPALAARKQKGLESVFDKKGLGRLWIVFRGVRSTFHILSQIASLNKNRVYLPGKGHKHVEVEEELVAAGLDTEKISKIGGQPISINKLISITFLISRRLAVSWPLFQAAHAFKYFETLFIYEAIYKWLQKEELSSTWIIIGDLSPTLISLSAACKHSGHNVVYWQYSFLDFKHMPINSDTAIILNNTGIKLSKADADKQIYWRNIAPTTAVRTKNINRGPVGILLNVLAHENAWDTIINIQKEIGLPCEVRFHPNSTLSVPELPKEITISDKRESLESFAERMSLAICGNTQAQAKLVMMGVPVLQLAGLDLLPFDFHGYIERDIVPGIEEPTEFDIDNIVSFYHSKRYKTGLYNLIGPTGKDRKPGLQAFVQNLMNRNSR